MKKQLMGNDKPQYGLPPFVKSWKQFYWLLLGWLLFLIISFFGFTLYFA